MGGEHVVHALLDVLRLPVLGHDLLEGRLPGDDLERPVLDLGLQHAHRAVEEHLGVGVVGRAGDELDVVGAVRLLGLEALEKRVALKHTHLEVVEGDVVVHGLGVGEQAVVGDDGDALLLGGLQLGAELGAVQRTDT